MFGQQLRIIDVIYIVLAIIIVSTAEISCDNARQHSGAYYVYNQVGLNQQNKLRNLYWYTMGQPMLSARKQRTVNFQIKPRYPSMPMKISSSYMNPLRTPYRSAYDGAISANTLKTYMTSISLSTTTSRPQILPQILPQIRYQSSKPYDEFSHPFEDSKSCTEKNLTVSGRESAITLPHNLRPLEVTSNSMPQHYNIAPVTPLPIVPYVSHTYFTLDDVVIPSSSDNLIYYKPERQERPERHESLPKITAPPPLTTHKSKVTENLITELFGTDLFDIMPVDKSKQLIPTMYPTVFIRNESKLIIPTTKSTFLDPILVKEVFDIISEPKTSTPPPEINTIANPKAEDIKTSITTTFSTIFSDITLEKLEEIAGYKVAKTFKEPLSTTTSTPSTPRTPTSTSFLNLLATKMKIAQHHKKFSPLAAKKISLSNHSVSSTKSTTTEVPRSAQTRKSRRTKTYPRQRKFDANATRLNNYNLTNSKSTYAKLLRPIVKSASKKPKIQTQNVTSTETPSTTVATRKSTTTTTVRTTEIPVSKTKSKTKSKSLSSNNFTETTAMAAESAIMTISNANANARNLRGSMQRFRKRLPELQKEFVHTTAIPQLPIELYFTKLTKSPK